MVFVFAGSELLEGIRGFSLGVLVVRSQRREHESSADGRNDPVGLLWSRSVHLCERKQQQQQQQHGPLDGPVDLVFLRGHLCRGHILLRLRMGKSGPRDGLFVRLLVFELGVAGMSTTTTTTTVLPFLPTGPVAFPVALLSDLDRSGDDQDPGGFLLDAKNLSFVPL